MRIQVRQTVAQHLGALRDISFKSNTWNFMTNCLISSVAKSALEKLGFAFRSKRDNLLCYRNSKFAPVLNTSREHPFSCHFECYSEMSHRINWLCSIPWSLNSSYKHFCSFYTMCNANISRMFNKIKSLILSKTSFLRSKWKEKFFDF